MVITDKFVYLHKPKTGGTFVTDALLQLYDGKWNLWVHLVLATRKHISFTNRFGTLTLTANKHGGCLEIPKGQEQKTIVTTIRNPYDYYVSQYEFGWWKRKEWLKYYRTHPNFDKRFAAAPDLSFEQFMHLLPAVFNDAPHTDFSDPAALGRYTIEFIKSNFREPEKVIDNLDPTYFQRGLHKKDMFPIQYLFTHNLNRQFYDFLVQQGYPESEVDFILRKEKVLPQGKGRSKAQKWERYYTPELKELVRKKDWFIFELFPEFDQEHAPRTATA